MPLEDNTCLLLPQPIMLTDTHCVSLVHVSAAGNEVPHQLYVAKALCSPEQGRPTFLQVSTNTRKRQPFEAFEVITEVCNRVCVCEVCACVRCVRV